MTLRIVCDIWIDRSPNEVFEALTDVELVPRFVPGVLRCEQLGDGSKGVGTRVASTTVRLGRTLDVIDEYTHFQPGLMLGHKSVSGPIDYIMTESMSHEYGGTRLKRVLEVDAKGFFGSLTAPLIRRSAQRNVELELATLKDLLEEARSTRRDRPGGIYNNHTL